MAAPSNDALKSGELSTPHATDEITRIIDDILLYSSVQLWLTLAAQQR